MAVFDIRHFHMIWCYFCWLGIVKCGVGRIVLRDKQYIWVFGGYVVFLVESKILAFWLFCVYIDVGCWLSNHNCRKHTESG